MNIAAELLSSLKCHLAESFIMEILARPLVQEKFTKSLIERALGRNISEHEYIHLNDGKWIKVANVFKYPYFKRAVEKVRELFLLAILTNGDAISSWLISGV